MVWRHKIGSRIKQWFKDSTSSSSNDGYPICSIDIQQQHLLVQLINERGSLQPWLTSLMVRLLRILYDDPRDFPPVKTLMVKVYPFDGVAFTKDGYHGSQGKEIHMSSTYLDKVSGDRRIMELEGVLCHEMVHAFQYDGDKSAPTGFIEGLADYFRMQMGLQPPHWKWKVPDKWDAGYEKTAYFFDFIERQTPNAAKRMNLYLRDHTWSERDVFKYACGERVDRLFSSYVSAPIS